jgi:MFS family permease
MIAARILTYACQIVLALIAVALGLLTWSHHLTAVWIYAFTVLSAAAMAFDNPSRQSLIPALVPPANLSNALSMMSVSFRTSTIIGPVLAGLLIARGGLTVTYFLNAASFLAVIWALLAIRTDTRRTHVEGEEKARVSIGALVEGLAFVRSSELLVSSIWLDFFATFFSSANSLLPIFARDILKVGARGYGLLAAAEAVGALLAGMALSFWPVIKRQGMVMFVAVGIYGASTVLFGASKIYALSWLALALVGASDSVSTILRQTIRQLFTPDRLRGRMTSVNMIFFMGGPQLGELESGIAAEYLGGARSVIIGGLACLATVLLVLQKAPVLRNYVAPDRTD